MLSALRALVHSVTAATLVATLAAEPVLAAAPVAKHATQLTGDARILHALNRLTFGPRPGDLAAVRKQGLNRWFDQQLHPASIDDSAFEHRLADLPAMQLPQTVLMERFPSGQRLKALARQNGALPTDPVEHAIYANGIAQEREREERKAADFSQIAQKGSAAPQPASDQALLGTRPDAKSSPPAAGQQLSASDARPAHILTTTGPPQLAAKGERAHNGHHEQIYPQTAAVAILSLAPDQRMSRILTLAPDELKRLRQSLSPEEAAQLADGLSPAQRETLAALGGPERVVNAEVLAARLERDIDSNRQLEAVMTDFWLNHFNVFVHKDQIEPYLLPAFERETIRPHALGRFEDLLLATASSSAMLLYLDNAESIGPHSLAAQQAPGGPSSLKPSSATASPAVPSTPPKPAANRGLNENYARELMELHTVGVRCETSKDHTPSDPACGAGYTQADVTEVARVLTGWTVTRPEEGRTATYIDRRHEPGDKHVLGHTIQNGGEREGVQLMHLLANDPATAEFISTKLAIRFVSDTPSPALIARMTETWRTSGGNISAVLRAMFRAPEFWSTTNEHAKVKTPLEFVASAVRASGAEVTDPAPLVQALAKLGMPLYGMQTPNGYAWTAESWVSTGALVARLNFALVLAGNQLPGTHVAWNHLPSSDASPTHLRPASLSTEGIPPSTSLEEHRLEQALLGGQVSARTRGTVVAQADDPDLTQRAGQDFLPTGARSKVAAAPPARIPGASQSAEHAVDSATITMAGLLLGSPEFQRR